ncbi:threonine synthase [Lobosporangium transversale]|uniref:threonine synthase n=1 Tax=Lobosporangium transversale TaxID=64571 RepID=A0A1Y2GJH9_9FUNG|nr:threonine synthase [Lobosporangium transversale]KAF9897745.1 threonine synthase [Lobosporangium transversale]ORZ12872.1 threonine synthase [Lobosporangium transversale]|eukprot:XP_021880221.1 threonine synthase [Lobosporangium transversale]
MKYKSTRGKVNSYTFEQAVLAGLSPDGGLFIPDSIPQAPADFLTKWASLSFQDLALEILSLYIDDTEIPRSDLKELVDRSYSAFRHKDITPLHKVKDGLYILELFHGPTFAFKDVALQFVGNLFEYFLKRRNAGIENKADRHKITVVGATSGDTGSAAIYGLRNKQDLEVFILFPTGRVSPIQEAQMTTVLDKNVHNISVKGTFDDCQDIVKGLFANKDFMSKYNLGAVNSINWARILAQTVYYFHSYFSLLRSLNITPASEEAKAVHITYSVPTGNFGDILAGYYAHQMGLPTSKLLVATNANDILYRFFCNGVCEKIVDENGGVQETLSPAMDIVVSSNFERLLFYLARDAALDASVPELDKDAKAGEIVNGWMVDLKQKGRFDTGAKVLAEAKRIFDAGHVSNEETCQTIRAYSFPADASQASYVMDPHTAVGVHAAETVLPKIDSQNIVISLSTAHPAKFSEAVEKALKEQEGVVFEEFFKKVSPKEFDGLMDAERRVTVIPRAEEALVIEVIAKELSE